MSSSSTPELMGREESIKGIRGRTVKLCRYGDPDAPAVLVIGGISGTHQIWNENGDGWWQGLSQSINLEKFSVVAPDYDQQATSISDQADYITEVLTASDLGNSGNPQLHAVIGGSFGGLVALELASQNRIHIQKLGLISAAHRPTAASVILRGLQREFVRLGDAAGDSERGIQLARALAMFSYRSASGLDRYHPEPETALDYVLSRGLRTVKRNPEHARALFEVFGQALDSYRFDPQTINQATAVIGFHSDQLVPPELLVEFSELLPNCPLLHITESSYGHDGFIKSTRQYATALQSFLEDAC